MKGDIVSKHTPLSSLYMSLLDTVSKLAYEIRDAILSLE
jgi:hypothetical protein